MIIDEPGHMYHVLDFDPLGKEPAKLGARLDFFKKIGEKFPGNVGAPMWGTNCQEVIRVLIHRCLYLNNQIPCTETEQIIDHLRVVLHKFESRAARVKNKEEQYRRYVGPNIGPDLAGIEDLPFCNICGHIYPHSHTGA